MAFVRENTSASLLTLTEYSRSSSDPLRWVRWIVGVVMVGILALVSFRLSCIRGWRQPIRVAESSMAETLLGEHFFAICPDCRFSFPCDADKPPGDMRAECPNCGQPHVDLRTAERRPGARVVVDRFPSLRHPPRIGDVVALRDPESPQRRLVKRVVALPGQQWGLDEGDLLIDGQTHRKSLDELRKLSRLVYDHNHPPREELKLPSRWQPIARGEGNHWQAEAGGFRFLGRASTQSEATHYFYDWIGYRHWRRVQVGAKQEIKPIPVLDNSQYDAGVNHPLHEVHDLYLRFRASMDESSCLVVAGEDGAHRFEVHLCREERQMKVFSQRHGEPPRLLIDPPTRLPYRLSGEPMVLEFALCDRQLLFGIDFRQVIAVPYERSLTARNSAEGYQLEIGASGAPNAVTVQDLAVYRDLFYVDPIGLRRPWMAENRVPPGCIAVLGDNPHVSRDSRHWQGDGVPMSDVLGRVYKPFFAD